LERCNNCILYSKRLDDLRNLHEDVREDQVHFCNAYEDGIPKDIWSVDAECEHHVPLEETE